MYFDFCHDNLFLFSLGVYRRSRSGGMHSSHCSSNLGSSKQSKRFGVTSPARLLALSELFHSTRPFKHVFFRKFIPMKASENGGDACLGTAGTHRLDDSTLVELAVGINTKSIIMRDTTTKEEGQKATQGRRHHHRHQSRLPVQ